MHTDIFDTHCHYNMEPLFSDWQKHWREAREAGVVHAVVVGTDVESSRAACKIAAFDPNVLAAFGIHPTSVTSSSPAITPKWLLDTINELSSIAPVSAIGETGLDYYRMTGSDQDIDTAKQLQKSSFLSHLVVAKQLSLPALLHVRDAGEAAYRDVIELLTTQAKKQTIVLHCFSGPEWYLDAALELGCYISFAGNLTYPNADHLRQLAKKVPSDRLLVETDAPYLPPQSHRGQICEPRYITETVSQLCSLLSLDPKELLNNARSIFTTIR